MAAITLVYRKVCLFFREYSVGFEVIAVSCNVPGGFSKETSGDFRYTEISVLSHKGDCWQLFLSHYRVKYQLTTIFYPAALWSISWQHLVPHSCEISVGNNSYLPTVWHISWQQFLYPATLRNISWQQFACHFHVKFP